MSSAPDLQTRGTILDVEVMQCPFAVHEKMRHETPVHFLKEGGFFVVSSFEDIEEVVAQPVLFSSDLHDFLGLGPKLSEQHMPAPAMFNADPPIHTRTRATVDRAFTAPRVEAMHGPIQAIVEELFEDFIDAGEVEVFSALAMPVPMRVIAGQLGVPREDIPVFKEWSDCVTLGYNQSETAEQKEKYAAPLAAFNAYMLAKRDEKKLNPAEDIISVLAAGEGSSEYGVADGRLSDKEFCSIVQQLLTAGNETTTGTILSIMLILARDPALFARVKADRSLIRNLVEETLRLEAPVQGLFRVAKEDAEIGGVAIPKNSMVYLLFASANRDETVFGCPNDLDLGRKNVMRHLAFGTGIHRCIGQMLARKEIACVVNVACDRFKTMAVSADDTSRYLPMLTTRSLDSLKLTFTREDV